MTSEEIHLLASACAPQQIQQFFADTQINDVEERLLWNIVEEVKRPNFLLRIILNPHLM